MKVTLKHAIRKSKRQAKMKVITEHAIHESKRRLKTERSGV